MSAPRPSDHQKYRPDIDGLRAIAVVIVVAFHAFPQWVRGGFIGVDVFFVISGFLISTIIFEGLDRQTFSFIDFYGRRIRRIFPALILVLVACFAFGWLVLLADEYKQLGKHIAGGAGFASNLLFWYESGYFDKAAETKPLLHLWSLGVEEQFYLGWPLILWLSWKRRSNLLLVTVTLLAVSFLLNILQHRNNPAADFYSPHTRLWEILVGAAVAYVALYKPAVQAKVIRLRKLLSVTGVAMLAIGLLAITRERHFPGYWALLPVLGCAMVLAAGRDASLNRILLSNKVLVWIGLISFPLYLWHVPLLVFARVVENETPRLTVRVAAVLAAGVLAWGTYRLVERPVRYGPHSALKSVVLLVLMFLTGYVGYNAYARDGLPFRQIAKATKSISAAIDDRGYPGALVKTDAGGVELYATSESAPEVLVFGDSHATQFAPRAAGLAKTGKIRHTAFLTDGGCSPIPLVFEDKHRECDKKIDNLERVLKASRSVTTIMIAGCWNCYFLLQTQAIPIEGDDYNYYYREGSVAESFRRGGGADRALSSLRQFLRELGKNYEVYLLLDNPLDFSFEPQRMISNRLSVALVTDSTTTVAPPQVALNEKLKAIAASAGVKAIDQLGPLCPVGVCQKFSVPGVPIHRDSHHLRPYFVVESASYVDVVWQNIARP